MTYQGLRRVEVGSPGSSVDCKAYEPPAGAWCSLGHVDPSWYRGLASSHFLKGEIHSPFENSEASVGQKLQYGDWHVGGVALQLDCEARCMLWEFAAARKMESQRRLYLRSLSKWLTSRYRNAQASGSQCKESPSTLAWSSYSGYSSMSST